MNNEYILLFIYSEALFLFASVKYLKSCSLFENGDHNSAPGSGRGFQSALKNTESCVTLSIRTSQFALKSRNFTFYDIVLQCITLRPSKSHYAYKRICAKLHPLLQHAMNKGKIAFKKKGKLHLKTIADSTGQKTKVLL